MNARSASGFDLEVSTGRRGFLEAAIFGVVSVIAGSFGLTSLLYLFRGPGAQSEDRWTELDDPIAPAPESPQRITFKRRTTDGWKSVTREESAWIVPSASGAVVAFSPSCTHLGCAYRWESARNQFICPCHGSAFSKTGEVLAGPASRPLDRYEVRRSGNTILIGDIIPSRKA